MPLLFDVWNLTTPFIHDAGLRQNERIFSDSQTISIIWALTTTICLGRGRLHLVIDQQEAQLSQRGRACFLSFDISPRHTRSLKVNGNITV